MKIEHLLIIPDKENTETSLKLADAYGCGFEYNDFFCRTIWTGRNGYRTEYYFIKI